jgi:hypothetical protein
VNQREKGACSAEYAVKLSVFRLAAYCNAVHTDDTELSRVYCKCAREILCTAESEVDDALGGTSTTGFRSAVHLKTII